MLISRHSSVLGSSNKLSADVEVRGRAAVFVVDNRHCERVVDVRESFWQGFEPSEQIKQTALPHRFDDQALPFLPHDGVGSLELELPGNAHRLIAPVPEQPNTADGAGLVNCLKAISKRFTTNGAGWGRPAEPSGRLPQR